MNVTKPVLTVSVRELVEFVLRRGDLVGSGDFVSSTRLLEGTWGHQRVQRSRPDGYQVEVSVTHRVTSEAFELVVRGRMDGVLVRGDELLIEEIKTVRAGWDGVADPLHWAQARIYAHLFVLAQPEKVWRKIELQLTYLELDSDYQTCLREANSPDDLQRFFDRVLSEYVRWLAEEAVWRQARDASIAALSFPFEPCRPGQAELSHAVRETLRHGGRLFVEAPTGLGKTMAVLYPAMQAIGEGTVERVFYLTAKTVGRTVAEHACQELRRAGGRWRSVTLTAREKVCHLDGQPCDARVCPRAVGYYDRVRPALREALREETLTRPVLEAVAERHQVCPFELSLDCSRWAELIIADYNYVFDPRVYLRRFLAEPGAAQAFLIDESHNLVERAREMFSASCEEREADETRRQIQRHLPKCARALARVQEEMRACAAGPGSELGVKVSREAPEQLLAALRQFTKEAEAWLVKNKPAPFRETLLEMYFRATGFLRTSESFDASYATLAEAEAGRARVRLFCLDPSSLLRQALDRGAAAVFFSATLSPLEYFRAVLGGEDADPTLRLASPFPPEHLRVRICARIATDFRARGGTHDEVAGEVAEWTRSTRGNYLIYFPSYDYLREVHRRFAVLCPARTLVQRSGMSESERAEFLGEFRADNGESLVGFAVLGGIFGEGIDLVGERLIGVAVVGVGLPQVCVERDLIRQLYQEKLGAGFEYAYLFPGINRVLQAAGRVIRSEQDRGAVLLIDRRFGESRYRRLLPAWWQWEFTGPVAPLNCHEDSQTRSGRRT